MRNAEKIYQDNRNLKITFVLLFQTTICAFKIKIQNVTIFSCTPSTKTTENTAQLRKTQRRFVMSFDGVVFHVTLVCYSTNYTRVT